MRDGVFDARQQHADRGPFADSAVDEDVAAALRHDPVHRRQAEPRALAGFLRRVERLEDVRERGFVHPETGVADDERDVRPGFHAGARIFGRRDI